MNKENKQENFKTGLTAIVARPNVGKSTLLNNILGQKIAIATPLRQTTRKNMKGIYTDSDSQIILIDTPGIHKPLNELGEYLSNQSKEALIDVDLILFKSVDFPTFGRATRVTRPDLKLFSLFLLTFSIILSNVFT